MKTKFKKIVIGIVIISVVFYGYRWFQIKKVQVDAGLAEPNFPYRNYTGEELEKLFPQIHYKDVQTRTTPEETYAKFREALRNNDLEGAVAQLAEEGTRYEEIVNDVKSYYEGNEFKGMHSYYPSEIKKESMYDNIASYYFIYEENGRMLRDYVSFQKNADGDWRMSSL